VEGGGKKGKKEWGGIFQLVKFTRKKGTKGRERKGEKEEGEDERVVPNCLADLSSCLRRKREGQKGGKERGKGMEKRDNG